MWTPTTRRQCSRDALRYESDLSDKQWRLIEPWIPPRCAHGRRRKWPWREIMNAIFYVMRGGISWRLLPDSFPPWQTVYRWFAAFRDTGLFERINHALVMMDRQGAGREASPSAAIIDSQSVKRPKTAAPQAMMRARRSRGASVMHWSIAMGAGWFCAPTPPASRTAMAPRRFSRHHADPFRLSNGSLPMPDTPGNG